MTLPISVVFVTWNSAAVLPAAIEALFASDPAPAEIIVIDNASHDGSAELFASMTTSAGIRTTVRRESTNTGFAAAANRGIELSAEPFVFLHNPDLRLQPATLGILVNAFIDGSDRLAAVGPKLLRASGDDLSPTAVIDSTGIRMTRDGRHFDRGQGELDHGQFDTATDVFGITGAATLFRRDSLMAARVDGQIFDEDFFAYREDVDLAWRLRGFGYVARYVPNAVAYHRRTVTPERRRQVSQAVNRHSVKNRFLLRIHHADRGWLSRFGAASLVRDAVVISACLTVERSSLDAFPWLARHLRRHLRRRRTILDRRVVSSGDLRRWFVSTGRET